MASKEELRRSHEKARLDKERERRNNNYLDYLDAKAKGEQRSYEQYRAHQRYVDKRDKKRAAEAEKEKSEQERIANLRKQEVTEGKKTRDLARQHSKFLKSNSGTLLKQLGLVHDTNALGQGARKAAEEGNVKEQAAWNRASAAQKQAYEDIESGIFDSQTYTENLSKELKDLDIDWDTDEGKKVWAKITGQAEDFGKAADEIIGGDPDAFANKMSLSKESMSAIDGFQEKVFKATSFITDPKFRGMMLKGMFIGLAVSAATKLGEALKGAFDFAREMGVQMSSMPIGVGLAREEASALLDEFKSLEGVTTGNLIAMKWNAYWYGVAATDSAKLMKLQMSITDSTKEMALKDQRDFMKELKKEGLSASKVMADMAGQSEFVAKFMKDGNKNIREAAKYSASMGLSLDHTSAIAESLLDFESSIAAEMEASVLLGRSINLDRARQLAFAGKLKDMQEEVKNQVGGEAEFAKMSVDQRTALGNMIGLNSVQLAEFVKAQDGAGQSAEKFKWHWVGIMGAIGAAIGLVIAAKNVLMTLNPLGATVKTAKDIAAIGKGGLMGGSMGALTGLAAAGIAGRNFGGPGKAGQIYRVNEGQTTPGEYYIPSTNGNFVPDKKMGGGNPNGLTKEQGNAIISLLSTRNDDARDQARKQKGATLEAGRQT